jgi:hypothetical protein
MKPKEKRFVKNAHGAETKKKESTPSAHYVEGIGPNNDTLS